MVKQSFYLLNVQEFVDDTFIRGATLSLFHWLLFEKRNINKNGEDYLSNRESVIMITKDNEKYRCILPKDETLNEVPTRKINGQVFPYYKVVMDNGTACDLLGNKPRTTNVIYMCAPRSSNELDTYWTYELCHGRHVKQFHELKAGVQVPTRKINGQVFPYYKVVMDNGTACDLLGNKPRTTNVIYMCAPRSSNEIISVKEIHTCHYEVEVLTPLICANPAYSYREKPVHHISCHSLDGSPDEPKSYSELMDEKFGVEGFMPPEDDDKSPVPVDEHRNMLPQPDNLLTASFLSGEYCLVGGGSGWWKFEFCYGKQVTQFHQEANGPRINILLGKWVKEAHISWKKDKWAGDGYTDHFYSGGDVCDLTGKPRNVKVRLNSDSEWVSRSQRIMDIETNKETDRQTDRQRERQKDRQTERRTGLKYQVFKTIALGLDSEAGVHEEPTSEEV
ncbi:Endoplasmic reticulum lectin 1 [Stylophora pistillata]|uniref:Endoplasmic reticulum lectin 1 n=1 Tax=Stylophora pistillata TaxID=50429 RepID=A0A2B4RDX7_STYPI|nr:Endoplasmic reticulum lectin 1 [Stylophora pistillata]